MLWLPPATLAVAAIVLVTVKMIARRKKLPPGNREGVAGGKDVAVDGSSDGVKPRNQKEDIEGTSHKPPAETDERMAGPRNPLPFATVADSEQHTEQEKLSGKDFPAPPDNERTGGDGNKARISPPPKPKVPVKGDDKITPAPPEPPGERPTRKSPPGIVCWENRNRQWTVGVEARPELAELKATQNGEVLEKERIPHAAGGADAFVCLRLDVPVEVAWEENGEAKTCAPRVPCDAGAFVIFSMRSDWVGIGRRVGHMTVGRCYVVVAPRTWDRIGSPLVADEAFLGDEWRAHYFKPENGESDGFRLPNGEEKSLSPKRGRFGLRGEKLSGTHPDTPPLFNAPPMLCDAHQEKWTGAREIVVGGENLGRDCRSPPPSSGDYDLDSLLAENPGGLFAVRVDDDRGEGLDAQQDFQFIRGLLAIDIHNARLLPGPGGHGVAKITFGGDCEIAPMETRTGVRLSGCVAEVSPHPDSDSTRWEIRNNGAKVEIKTLLERIWWALGPEDEKPAKWESRPLALPDEDFSVTSSNGLWIRLPYAGFAKNVYIGFSGEMSRYRVTARERFVFAPLREFAIAMQQGVGDILLGMSPDNESDAVTITRVIRKSAGAKASAKPAPSLNRIGVKPQVVKSGRRRNGKGFSMAELRDAGLTSAQARCDNLPIDKRRESSHRWNVAALTAT